MEKQNKIIGMIAITTLLVLALSAFASAFVLAPVVSISASPNSTTFSSTIVAVATDLSGSGISSVKIYENGAKVKECPTSTCVYVAVQTTPGVRNYYAVASDNKGSATTSQ